MALPKIQSSLFELIVPTTKEKLLFRPFTVKEEKILLFAKQSGENADIERSVKQIVNNCVQGKIDVNKMSSVDLLYLFLKIRAKSSDNVIKLKYRDLEDDEVRTFEVDLEEIEVQFSENYNPKIKLTDSIGIVMRPPTVEFTSETNNILTKLQTNEDPIGDFLDEFIIHCLEKIYDEENIYLASDSTKEELKEFLNSLPADTYPKIRDFFNSLPKIEHVISYTNSKGSERQIVLNKVSDFFS